MIVLPEPLGKTLCINSGPSHSTKHFTCSCMADSGELGFGEGLTRALPSKPKGTP